MDNNRQYIRKKAKEAKINNGFIINGVEVFVEKNVNFDIEEFLKNIFSKLPNSLINSVNKIVFGNFYFDSGYVGKSINDSIFINSEENKSALKSSLIHEMAHNYITKNYEMVFGDNKLNKEFLTKRKKLYHKIRSSGLKTMPYESFKNHKFDKKFNKYLSEEIGYNTLSHLISGIFPTCYSVSSSEEYFSVGMELFYTKKIKMLEDCPILMEKIVK